MEYNIDDENQRRSEHSIVDFVITIPTFYDDEFEAGYAAADALEVSRNSGDTTKIDINSGAAYIGGRRYKQINDNVAYDLTGSTDNLYYIRLRYTLSTNTFTFMVETSESSDSETSKYLTLASATWDTTPGEWLDDFSDLRATNTSLPPPITFAGSSASPILTIQQDGTGLALKVVGNATGGDVTFFDTTDPRTVTIYGTITDALTIYEDGSSFNVKLVADNTDRLKVLSNLYVPTATTLGSMSFSATTISGVTVFDCGASPSFATSSGDFAWGSENFTGVGSIACASVDATGNIQGDVLISDITTGTAPLTITSTTVVSNLNVDQVDGYDFTGTTGSVSASAAELNNLDGYTGDLADLNRITESGRSQGDVLYASAAATLAWLSASDGYLNNDSGVISWDSSPVFTGATVDGATGMTWDNTTTDVVVTSTDGELYFGDAALIADKETSPDWSISGAGAGTFASVGATTITASTTLSVTSGPSMTSAGIATAKALSGVTTISGTGAWDTTSTIDFSGILSGATKAELNTAADATGRLAGDIWYASANATLGWIARGTTTQLLRVNAGGTNIEWWTLPTYDNYASWTYKLDGGDQDAVGSAETLEFVSGDDISIIDTGTRIMTFNVVTTSTATDADASPISSNWAYDHADGETMNLHTKVGSITSGTWGGTVIAANKGGTGQTAYTTGDILYASGTTNIAKLGIGAAGTVLVGGATPSWDSTPSVSTITTTGSGSSIAGSASVGGVTLNSGGITATGTINGVDITLSGDIAVNGGNITCTQTELRLGTSSGTRLILGNLELKPYTDHLLDLGNSARAWDTLYRLNEIVTSYVGIFDDPIENVKMAAWQPDGHLIHTTLPESIRTLRLNTEEEASQITGRLTGKKVTKGGAPAKFEFISDEHYDTDGMDMLLLQTLQRLIERVETLEARVDAL
jgi:hypothetical protein